MNLHSDQLIKASAIFLHGVLVLVILAGIFGANEVMVVDLAKAVLSAIALNILIISGHKNLKDFLVGKYGESTGAEKNGNSA